MAPNRLIALLFVFTFLFDKAGAAAEDTDALDLSFSMEKTDGGAPSGWKPMTFRKIKRHTIYRLVEEDGRTVLEAKSDNSASGLVYEMDFPASKRPILKWKWKIKKTLEKGDARYKASDDFAARVYVVFKRREKVEGLGSRIKLKLEKLVSGRYSPGAALNYIWANRLPKSRAIKNAYSSRAMMIAVESGDNLAGQWVEESVDIESDYRKYFKADPPQVLGVAIMTDSDNTGGRAEAWYADISLSGKKQD